MKHPTEHQIGMYVLDPARAADDVRQHISECGECRQIADDIRAFESELANPANWDGLEPAEEESGAAEELRAFEMRFQTEYAEAVEVLKEYEKRESAARFAAYGVANLPQLQTPGAVRRLCELANDTCERHPLYALTLAEAAVAISSRLPANACAGDAIHDLRGEAWKEVANALRYLGRFPEALRALDAADEQFARLSHRGVGPMAVKYVRGWVLLEQDALDDAERLAEAAAADALRLGDRPRAMSSRHLLGIVKFERRQYEAAINHFEELLRAAEESRDEEWIALESLAIGSCWIERGDGGQASVILERALTIYARQRNAPQMSRTRWAMARALFQQGAVLDATNTLRAVVRELGSSGLLTDSAAAAVDLAEMLLAIGRSHEVVKLLTGVTQTFTRAGKLSGALAALAFLKDAAAAGVVHPGAVAHVRRFIRRTERQPDLLFAPPPRAM